MIHAGHELFFQERPRKFKRHHSAQCRVPGTGDDVKNHEMKR